MAEDLETDFRDLVASLSSLQNLIIGIAVVSVILLTSDY